MKTTEKLSSRARLSKLWPEVQNAITDYVKHVVAAFPDDVLAIILYGSQSRGDALLESDIDLFIVVRRNALVIREALADLAWQVQFEHDVIISDVIRSLDQFDRMRSTRFPYYQNIEREGIVLWKSKSEL